MKNAFNRYICIYLKEIRFLHFFSFEEMKKREKDLVSAVSLPKYPKQLGLSQTKKGIWNSVQVSQMNGRDPST